MKLTDVKAGQTVIFQYLGEKDTVPKKRMAKVLEVKPDHIIALDLQKNELRNFISHRAIQVQAFSGNIVVKDRLGLAQEIFKGPYPQKISGRTLEMIYKNLHPDVKDCSYDDENDCLIIVNKPTQPHIQLCGNIIRLVNEKGEALDIQLSNNLSANIDTKKLLEYLS